MSPVRSIPLAIIALLAALGIGWVGGRASREEAPVQSPQAAPKVLYYRNPMGLPDTSLVPKKDPMGMDYIPVHAGEDAPVAPGTVVLTPDRVQALGVRTEPTRRESLAGVVRTSGTVEIDEARQYAIAPRFEGWVENLHANRTGMHVRAGEPLLTVYSPQLAAAQQEYRLADATARRLATADPASADSMMRVRDAARERLRNWGIGAGQVASPGRDGAPRHLVITSPANAVVIDKPVVQGARFGAGETILRLADLSTVWVVAKVPVAQAVGITAGQPADFASDALPGRTSRGEVTFVQPVVDASTRSVDVRIELANPDGDLRPGLFGAVRLEQPDPRAVLTIPKSAVLDTGTRRIALVQSAPGRYAQREIVTGRRVGDRVEVLDGLDEGEPVVVSANFLIDAESNLQSALQGLTGHAGHADHGAAAHASSEAPASTHAQAEDEAVAPRAPHDGHADHEGH